MIWTRQKLADVAQVVRGVSFESSEVRHYQAEDTLPILRAGNIQDALDIESDLVWVPRRRISDEQMMRKGDIAIAMSSGSIAIVGKTARLDRDWTGSVGAFCAIIRPKSVVLDKFLDFYLRGPQFNSWRQATGIGLNIKNLRRSDLETFPVPVPAPSEQRRIVEILDQADLLRKNRARADDMAERILTALFYKIFRDPLENISINPSVTIGTLIKDAQYGLSERANGDETGTPIIRMNNIEASGNLDLTNVKYVHLSQEQLEKFHLEEGDILFNRTNSKELVGKTGLWKRELTAVPASYLIRIKVDRQKVIPEFLWAYMNTPFFKRLLFDKSRRAIGMANINATELRSFPAFQPELGLQEHFRSTVDDISSLNSKRLQSRQTIELMFNVLLHRAFAGHLTAKWREAHMKELLQEIEEQTKLLGG